MAALVNRIFWIQETNYRVWYSRNGVMYHTYVQDPQEARRIIKEQTRLDLGDAGITINVFGLEERDSDGGWFEWYDENDRSITDEE